MSFENPDFLKKKYQDLHTAKEVERAALNTERSVGEDVGQNPADRIQNYLDRLERLALDPDKEQPRAEMFGGESRPRALSLLREMVMNRYIRPHQEKMAEGAARVEERAAREMGLEAHYGEQELEQRGDIAVEDLEKSLDQWISYLSDANEPYPVWFRYYAFRNVLDLGDYDKDKGEFTKRSPGSFHLFPDIDRGALAYVQQMIEASKDKAVLERLQQAQKSAALENIPDEQLITQAKAKQFANWSFAKQYTEAIKQSGEITPEMREETRGAWVKYQKDTDPTALWASLQSKGAAWCTKGFGTAQTQLQGGDFYVYYTLDKQGKPTIPRVAIRMQGDNIGEVRGVLDNQQNLEGNMIGIAEAKMNELPGAEKYKQASSDMKQLTSLEKKTKAGEQLTKDDLVFLYEIDHPIEGFGYQTDPRIKEIRDTRNPEADMLMVFECTPQQIAHNPQQINESTKAYVGPLVQQDEQGKTIPIFELFQQYSLEHLYTSFPEGKIRQYNVAIGVKNKAQLKQELDAKNIHIYDWANDLLESKDFTTLKTPEQANLARLTVKDLGFPQGATTDEIYQRAQELGLELCPAEVGPHFRLSYTGRDLSYTGRDWIGIGMKQIVDRGGYPGVFSLGTDSALLALDANGARPGDGWGPGGGFVFCLRKKLET